nr:uncharacterized protein LOC124817490 [Hydra vulgaris]
MLACRHHVLEVILKHYWLAVTIDKTTEPDNAIFKGLKSKWNDIDVKNCVITHFKWQSIYDSWFNEQAEKARKCLMTIVNEGVFKNSETRLPGTAELALMFLKPTFKPLNIHKPGAVHHACFMAKSIYYLKIMLLLNSTKQILKLSQEKINEVKKDGNFYFNFLCSSISES